jgi:hypothetical protein
VKLSEGQKQLAEAIGVLLVVALIVLLLSPQVLR